MTGFWGIMPAVYSLMEDPVALLFLLSVSKSFPWGSLQQHVGTTAKIKPFEAVPPPGRIPVHVIYPT